MRPPSSGSRRCHAVCSATVGTGRCRPRRWPGESRRSRTWSRPVRRARRTARSNRRPPAADECPAWSSSSLSSSPSYRCPHRRLSSCLSSCSDSSRSHCRHRHPCSPSSSCPSPRSCSPGERSGAPAACSESRAPTLGSWRSARSDPCWWPISSRADSRSLSMLDDPRGETRLVPRAVCVCVEDLWKGFEIRTTENTNQWSSQLCPSAAWCSSSAICFLNTLLHRTPVCLAHSRCSVFRWWSLRPAKEENWVSEWVHESIG